MSARRAGFNLAETSAAIALVALAACLLNALVDVHSRQLTKLERSQAPAHARLECVTDNVVFLVTDGAPAFSATTGVQITGLSVDTTKNPNQITVDVKTIAY